MIVTLRKASIVDANAIHRMQVASFSTLLAKYHDYELNPAAEDVTIVESRLNNPVSDYYLMLFGSKQVGAVRVVSCISSGQCRISPVFVLPAFQGRGIAQDALRQLESMYHPENGWVLQTISEEAGNCYLYEKLGYKAVGTKSPVKETMHLVTYEKRKPAQSGCKYIRTADSPTIEEFETNQGNPR